jgi:hypothetical protein
MNMNGPADGIGALAAPIPPLVLENLPGAHKPLRVQANLIPMWDIQGLARNICRSNLSMVES